MCLLWVLYSKCIKYKEVLCKFSYAYKSPLVICVEAEMGFFCEFSNDIIGAGPQSAICVAGVWSITTHFLMDVT